MLLHPAASSLPDRAPDLHHDRHHRRRQRRSGGFVLSDASLAYNVVCAYNPVTDSVVKTVAGSEFYLQHQKVLDVLITFVFGVGFPLRRDGGGDDDDDNNGDEASSGCCLEGPARRPVAACLRERLL